MAFGGICGSLLGGYALTNLAINQIFLLFSLLASIQLLSCGLVKESPLGGRILPESSNSGNSHISKGDGDVLDEDISVSERSSISSSKKRKKSRMNKKKKKTVIASISQGSEKDGSLALQWFLTLKMATYSLCSVFRQPIILR